MRCTITAFSIAARVPLLLNLRTTPSTACTLSSSSIFITAAIRCSSRKVTAGTSTVHATFLLICGDITMTYTSIQTRSMKTKGGDTDQIKPPPLKKKAKTVKENAGLNKKGTAKSTKNGTSVKDETVNVSSETLVDGKPWYTFFTKGDAVYEAYMTNEWGYEKHGDEALFEKLSLEGAQAGLSWRTILHKREAYRTTFYNFIPETVATMTEADIERIMNKTTTDPKNTSTVIVRNRGKIESVIHNAKLILQMKDEQIKNSIGSRTSPISEIFAHYLWSFVDHKPILNYHTIGNSVSTSLESEAMSKALKKYGFKYVGPTTCYSLMQAVGMVIDHPYDTCEWNLAHQRLQQRPDGYQDRKP